MIFADIIAAHKTELLGKLSLHQQRVLSKIEVCRTAALGAHLYRCQNCESVHLLHNSCSNRNCPICGGSKRRQWIQKQCDNLVNVPYYHVVFTVPDVLNALFIKQQSDCYNVLFQAAWQTLRLFFANDKQLQGKGGMLCILHTWGQNLAFHPHLHCLVPAAGIGNDGELKLVRGGKQFLFNVKAMAKVFRAKFAEKLTALEKSDQLIIPEIIRKQMFAKRWVVFAQRPFSTPQNVVRYIGMYSHRVAISQNRISHYSNGTVSFGYKDYKDGAKLKTMSLEGQEFLRRFAMHILPYRFMKIRYFGLLNNRCKRQFLQTTNKILGAYIQADDVRQMPTDNREDNSLQTDTLEELDDEMCQVPKSTLVCPKCKSKNMLRILSLSPQQCRHGFMAIDTHGQILFDARAGPSLDSALIIQIN